MGGESGGNVGKRKLEELVEGRKRAVSERKESQTIKAVKNIK